MSSFELNSEILGISFHPYFMTEITQSKSTEFRILDSVLFFLNLVCYKLLQTKLLYFHIFFRRLYPCIKIMLVSKNNLK